jgi:hypothetical protein
MEISMKLFTILTLTALISAPSMANTCRRDALKALAQLSVLNDNFVVPKQATLGASEDHKEYNYFSYLTPSYSEVQAIGTVTMNTDDCSVSAINIEYVNANNF